MGLRDGRLVTAKAVAPRGVINTSGAGDALFASFIHAWLATGNPIDALQTAVVYAGWQVGSVTPSRTLPNGEQARVLRARHPVEVRVGRWDTEGGIAHPHASVA
jgi:sugar/nucleoside kinase (ribokinase family)